MTTTVSAHQGHVWSGHVPMVLQGSLEDVLHQPIRYIFSSLENLKQLQLTPLRPASPSANYACLCYYLHSPWDSGAGKIRTFIFASYFTETKCNIPPDTFQGIVIKCLKNIYI